MRVFFFIIPWKILALLYYYSPISVIQKFLARKQSEDGAWQHCRTNYVIWQNETFFYTHEEAGQTDSDIRRSVLTLNILWWSYLPSGNPWKCCYQHCRGGSCWDLREDGSMRPFSVNHCGLHPVQMLWRVSLLRRPSRSFMSKTCLAGSGWGGGGVREDRRSAAQYRRQTPRNSCI